MSHLSEAASQSTLPRWLRAGYIASTLAGAPVLLFGLIAAGIMVFGGLNEDGVIEASEPPLSLVAVNRIALGIIVLAYLQVVFRSQRRSGNPWIVFGLLAVTSGCLALGFYSAPADAQETGPDWITLYLAFVFLIYLGVVLLGFFVRQKCCD